MLFRGTSSLYHLNAILHMYVEREVSQRSETSNLSKRGQKLVFSSQKTFCTAV